MSSPECVALTSRTLLEVARQQQRAGEQAEGRRSRPASRIAPRAPVGRAGASGMTGAAARRSTATNATARQPADDRPPVRLEPAGSAVGCVRSLSPTSSSPTRDRSAARSRRGRAACRGARCGRSRRAARAATTASAASADRQVDGEHRAPADVVGEEAADERPGDEADAHQPGERALQRRAAAAGEEVGDEDERQPLERAGAEALQRRASAISCPMSCAVAASAEPARNSTMPISSSARRPWRSDSRA